MNNLSKEEIDRRMVEWRNLKVLHQKAVAQNTKLKRKLENANEEIQQLRILDLHHAEMIEALQLQVEELRRMVFGRKKKKKDDEKGDGDGESLSQGKEEKKRDKDSYKRPLPKEEEVTAKEYHELEMNCPDCGTSLQDKETTEFYEEDIPLPEKESSLKQVVRHSVERGWCVKCRKWHNAIPLASTKVVLGRNVRLYLIYLSILLRLSFSQIRALLWDTYHFRISEGEIAKILHLQADKLKPEFERLKKKLQTSEGVHLDETGWCRGRYLWVMAAVEGEDVLYLAGKSRGKGIADQLLGKEFKGVRVTDGYTAYNDQPGEREQCWAHPNRKLEDLTRSDSLEEEVMRHCQETFAQFSVMYAKLRGYLAEPFEKDKRAEQKAGLLQDIRKWRQPHDRDPKKLRNIKLQFLDYESEWLTCMDHEGIPCDNNKAERMLRHFVIKRKISFGNKSKKGYETFETLASVLMTTWKTYQNSFFPQLRLLCA